jgi:hypothetical protein
MYGKVVQGVPRATKSPLDAKSSRRNHQAIIQRRRAIACEFWFENFISFTQDFANRIG